MLFDSIIYLHISACMLEGRYSQVDGWSTQILKVLKWSPYFHVEGFPSLRNKGHDTYYLDNGNPLLVKWHLCIKIAPRILCIWREKCAWFGSMLLYPPNNEVVGGYIGFTPSVCPSVRPSVRPACRVRSVIYSSGWILSILATNEYYHERVCRTQWPLTLTYIFKVIWPWLRKLCPLWSDYSSGWILFIFSTNDHYH